MTDTAIPIANWIPANETAAPDAADLGVLIFASIERIREQVRLERACQRTAKLRIPAGR